MIPTLGGEQIFEKMCVWTYVDICSYMWVYVGKLEGSAKLCNYFGVCRVLLLACEGDFLSLQWHIGVTMGSLWGHYGALWVDFGVSLHHSGVTLEDFGPILAPCGGHFGHFWPALGSLLGV